MRKKEWKTVISFNTTAEAIAMEAACKEDEVPGRLIPVPGQISAGCGLAWAMPAEWEGDIEQWMKEKELRWDCFGEYLI